MKRFLLAAGVAAICLAGPALAHDTLDVVGDPGQVERDSTNLIAVWTGPSRFQFVYAQSTFGTTPLRLQAITFRFDQSVSPQNGDFTYKTGTDFSIRLGTVVGATSPAYDRNLNATTRTVMSGVHEVHARIGGLRDATKDWGITFDFDSSFLYDPTAGHLVVDLAMTPSARALTLDAIQPSSYGLSVGPLSEARNVFYQLPVARFTYGDDPVSGGGPSGSGPVPEPATWAMMIAGFGLIGAATRRDTRRVSAHA